MLLLSSKSSPREDKGFYLLIRALNSIRFTSVNKSASSGKTDSSPSLYLLARESNSSFNWLECVQGGGLRPRGDGQLSKNF